MKAILNRILADENHPGGIEGKTVVLLMKFGAELSGFLKSHEEENIYFMTALMRDPKNPNKGAMMGVYINCDDVAMVTVPKPESRIAVYGSIDEFGGKVK